MYHRYCGIAGRVIAAANRQTPLFPITPIPLSKIPPPTITYDKSMKMATVASSKQSAENSTVCPEIRRLQKKFQEDNDIPVHLKGGPMDKILMYTTFGLIAVGLSMTFHFVITEVNKS